MKGRFWDDFVEVFKTMDRGEVKSTLFREVFYSHSTTTRNREYAKQFAQIYPNVWHSIRMMKKVSKGNLPNQMMSFESRLFGKILRRCFEKDWCVVSIHDAIIILDVVENGNLDIDELRGIMMEEYARCGLYPTISIEMR
jgi:predicted nucleotidyltransferase